MTKELRAIKSGFDACFPKQEFDARIRRLKKELVAGKIDLYVTSGAENIFYLTGQQSPGYYMFQCLAVPAKGSPMLMTRGLETYNAKANTYLASVTGYPDGTNPGTAVADLLVKKGWKGKRIAIDRDAWFLTPNLYDNLVANLGKRLKDGAGIVERLRRVKSPRELASMRKSAAANDAGMAAGLKEVKAGASENDVAAAVMGETIRAGGEYVGMEPFVVSGPRSGLPHGTWRRRKIRNGDLVILETAACYNRYHAALFRTVAVGKVPAKALDMFAVVQEALDAGLKQIKPGNTCADPHIAVQSVIDKAKFGYAYRKRSGYSLGISFAPDWGEGNILSLFTGVDVPFEPGMVFHIPITLREYGKWTVAESESVVVTANGYKRLSKLPRGLITV